MSRLIRKIFKKFERAILRLLGENRIVAESSYKSIRADKSIPENITNKIIKWIRAQNTVRSFLVEEYSDRYFVHVTYAVHALDGGFKFHTTTCWEFEKESGEVLSWV